VSGERREVIREQYVDGDRKWVIEIHDDQPITEGKQYAADNRVVVLLNGERLREFMYPGYRIWTAHVAEHVAPLLAAARAAGECAQGRADGACVVRAEEFIAAPSRAPRRAPGRPCCWCGDTGSRPRGEVPRVPASRGSADTLDWRSTAPPASPREPSRKRTHERRDHVQ
jgi:hypothetical protein